LTGYPSAETAGAAESTLRVSALAEKLQLDRIGAAKPVLNIAAPAIHYFRAAKGNDLIRRRDRAAKEYLLFAATK